MRENPQRSRRAVVVVVVVVVGTRIAAVTANLFIPVLVSAYAKSDMISIPSNVQSCLIHQFLCLYTQTETC